MRGPAIALAWALLEAPGAPAEARPAPGALLEPCALEEAGGGPRRGFLSAGRVSVFAFVRPGQDHSRDTLAKLADLEREFSSRPVAFAAIVSGAAPPADVDAMVREAGVRMPVLLDAGDRLYGRLEVRLHPVVGVADADGRLVALEPFRQVNQAEVLRARIRQALGEIGAAEAARALDPPRSSMPGDDPLAVARRDEALARMLLERGSPAPALASARRALSRDPGSARAHALAGRALAALGRCAEALVELDRALRLDPGDAAARSAREACAP